MYKQGREEGRNNIFADFMSTGEIQEKEAWINLTQIITESDQDG